MALFRNVDHAIKFAFAVKELSEIESTMAILIRAMTETKGIMPNDMDRLTYQEWRAQAALVRGRINMLKDNHLPEFCYIIANYSWGTERAVAIHGLAMYLVEMLSCLEGDKFLAGDLCRRYFDKNKLQQKSQAAIAKKNDTTRKIIRNREEKVFEYLYRLGDNMEAILAPKWLYDGVIEY
jgi:hypothetical protein